MSLYQLAKQQRESTIDPRPDLWRMGSGKVVLGGCLLLAGLTTCAAQQTRDPQLPRLAERDGRFALMVEGQPYLMLGAQINNSSSWPSTLPEVWPALADMHVNTVEAPVYWQVMEPQPGTFDFSNVDLLIQGARAHHLHLVLLWFGTWKNGQNHYAPAWMKEHPETYPREISAYGKVAESFAARNESSACLCAVTFCAMLRMPSTSPSLP